MENQVLTKALNIYQLETRQWPCALLDNKYSLGEELGHGTYGSVYKARLKESIEDKYYALKKMEHIEDKN